LSPFQLIYLFSIFHTVVLSFWYLCMWTGLSVRSTHLKSSFFITSGEVLSFFYSPQDLAFVFTIDSFISFPIAGRRRRLDSALVSREHSLVIYFFAIFYFILSLILG
jgi:hypothetical protein